jgi:hypothetical protein
MSKYLIVRFDNISALRNKNELPKEVRPIELGDPLPEVGNWFFMERLQLNDYLSHVKLNSERLGPQPTQEYIVRRRIDKSIKFGVDLIKEVAAENVLLNLNSTQIAMVLAKCQTILGLLQTGAISTAYLAMMTMQPDQVLTKDRIDRYIDKTKKFLDTLE